MSGFKLRKDVLFARMTSWLSIEHLMLFVVHLWLLQSLKAYLDPIPWFIILKTHELVPILSIVDDNGRCVSVLIARTMHWVPIDDEFGALVATPCLCTAKWVLFDEIRMWQWLKWRQYCNNESTSANTDWLSFSLVFHVLCWLSLNGLAMILIQLFLPLATCTPKRVLLNEF